MKKNKNKRSAKQIENDIKNMFEIKIGKMRQRGESPPESFNMFLSIQELKLSCVNEYKVTFVFAIIVALLGSLISKLSSPKHPPSLSCRINFSDLYTSTIPFLIRDSLSPYSPSLKIV